MPEWAFGRLPVGTSTTLGTHFSSRFFLVEPSIFDSFEVGGKKFRSLAEIFEGFSRVVGWWKVFPLDEELPHTFGGAVV